MSDDTITVRMDEKTKEALRRDAERNERTLTQTVRLAVRNHLKQSERGEG